eukprot:CAMPEP_0181169420 /NCGR_PEP_ID=MMETSP1096-20121128/806_1 /TAXON_ID=156174 ORGANISM="Chrysochromulina ericina, Strain CCMP281" /NCGR_SAMPLE_ID=MMETSP1096 /ASSEMBLY_ACC=CAM_ASM_000453 /LENGTH=89 /DNA_ID=CAMNT_0023256879 /DNA_START=660 /DNA_END=925 /DNA_ORIENTATION=+
MCPVSCDRPRCCAQRPWSWRHQLKGVVVDCEHLRPIVRRDKVRLKDSWSAANPWAAVKLKFRATGDRCQRIGRRDSEEQVRVCAAKPSR